MGTIKGITLEIPNFVGTMYVQLLLNIHAGNVANLPDLFVEVFRFQTYFGYGL
jgi:hypothetical protein